MFPIIQWQEFWELSTAWTAVFDGWNVNDKEWEKFELKSKKLWNIDANDYECLPVKKNVVLSR